MVDDITPAILANLAFRLALAPIMGGGQMARHAAAGMGVTGLGLGLGLAWAIMRGFSA